MQHQNSTFLGPFPFFHPYYLSTSPHRCLDTNENSIWSCTFLTAYCYKNRKKICLPQNPQTLLKKEFLNSFYVVLSSLLSWGWKHIQLNSSAYVPFTRPVTLKQPSAPCAGVIFPDTYLESPCFSSFPSRSPNWCDKFIGPCSVSVLIASQWVCTSRSGHQPFQERASRSVLPFESHSRILSWIWWDTGKTLQLRPLHHFCILLESSSKVSYKNAFSF